MKFPFSSNNSFLVLYTAGTGGEFLTSTISKCVEEMNTIPVEFIEDRWVAVCKVAYSEVAINDNNHYTEHYKGDTSKVYDIYKDHYQKPIEDYWPKDMTVICLEVTKDYDFWANLCYKKLKNYITINKNEFLYHQKLALDFDCKNILNYTSMFDNSHVVNIDNMQNETIGHRFLKCFPSLDVEKFNSLQQTWITANNEL